MAITHIQARPFLLKGEHGEGVGTGPPAELNQQFGVVKQSPGVPGRGRVKSPSASRSGTGIVLAIFNEASGTACGGPPDIA